MHDRIPVTVVSGSLGAGKTTLLNHLLANADRRLAVLVNDVGDVNVDADLLEGTDLARDGIAELSNGCICCELQDDLETEVRALAGRYDFDHLVVEASGISEPAPVARLFTVGDASARYDVDALVTVVDAARLARVIDGETLERETAPEDTNRPLSDLLVEQIEVSNIVLLNKCDRVETAELDRLEAVVAALQPDADVLRTTFSEVDPDRLLGRDAFDPAALGELAGWQRALADAREHEDEHGHENEGAHERGDHGDHDDHHSCHAHDDHDHRTPESVYGIESTTYRRRRPFDPAAFAAALRELPPSIVRLKGPCWIAGHDDLVVQLSGAGRAIDAEATGPWIASLPPAQRELYRENHPDVPWDDRHGDRRTELVFIGTDVDEAAIERTLDPCLVEPNRTIAGDASAVDSVAASDATETANGEAIGEHDPFPTERGERTIVRDPRESGS